PGGGRNWSCALRIISWPGARRMDGFSRSEGDRGLCERAEIIGAMAKPHQIELPTGENLPILYEDRSVLAIDKPRGWMLVPFSWQRTSRNLQAALISSMTAGDFWARSRGLRFLRFIHRLYADTTGILLLGKSPCAGATFWV